MSQFRIGDDGVPVFRKLYTGLPSTPGGMTSDRNGRFVYVSFDTSATIQVYRIDDSSGDLRLIQTVTGSGLSNSREAATVDVTNRFLYQVNGNATISVFSIDPLNGTLTSVAVSSTTAAGGARFGAIHPSNSFFYSGNIASNTVSYHSRNSDGSLTLQGIGNTGGSNGSSQIAIDSAGQNLYVPTFNTAENIYWFNINQTNGSLSGVGSILCGNSCYQVWVHPNNRFVFAGGTAGHFIYSRNTTSGALTGPISTLGPSFRTLAPHPLGTNLYTVANGNPPILRSIQLDASTGAMTQLGTQNSQGDCTVACGIAVIGSIVF